MISQFDEALPQPWARENGCVICTFLNALPIDDSCKIYYFFSVLQEYCTAWGDLKARIGTWCIAGVRFSTKKVQHVNEIGVYHVRLKRGHSILFRKTGNLNDYVTDPAKNGCEVVANDIYNYYGSVSYFEKFNFEGEKMEELQDLRDSVQGLRKLLIDLHARDLPVSDWAKEAVKRQIDNNVTDGSAPRALATREEAICMIDRSFSTMFWILVDLGVIDLSQRANWAPRSRNIIETQLKRDVKELETKGV